MAIQTTDIADLTNATLTKYRRDFMSDAATALQSYTACEKLLSKKRLMFDSGTQYSFPIIHTADNNTRAVGYFEVNNLDQVEGTVMATVPWRFATTGCHYDVKQLSVNDGAERIFNFLKKIEYQMWIDLFDNMEAWFWRGNWTGTTDTTTPYGMLGYWLSYTGLSSTPGLNGANHANFSSGPAGVSSTTYTGWKHGGATYTNISSSDAVTSMRKLYRLCGFRGIPNKPIAGTPVEQMFGIYTTLDALTEFEDLADNKNENIGFDLAKYDGNVMFRRVSLEWVPYLQTNHATSDPIIGLDWQDLRTVALKGMWLRETPYKQSGTQDDVRERYVHCSFQNVMHSRRRHWLLAKSDPMSD